jgi:hypothetical protein
MGEDIMPWDGHWIDRRWRMRSIETIPTNDFLPFAGWSLCLEASRGPMNTGG